MTELSREALAVIEKVKKLLALATSSNEHEAALASSKAAELLAAYNLDMRTVSAPEANSGERTDQKRKGGLYQWQRDLWDAVARLNFCMYWGIKGLAKGSSYQHRVLGSTANVVTTELMAEYLQSTVERLAQQWAKERLYNVFAREAIAYREGCADRLVQRMNEIRWKRRREAEKKQAEEKARSSHPSYAPSNALTILEVVQSEEDFNNDYLRGWEPGTSARMRHQEKLRREKAQREADEALAARDAAEAADPSLKEARLAKEAAARAADAAYWAKFSGKGRAYRERAETAREKRQRLSSYRTGYDKGADIGLDRQVGNKGAPKLK